MITGSRGTGSRLLRFSAGSAAERAGLREEFAERNCVVLGGFFEPGLLEEVVERVRQAAFRPRRHGHIGTEECMEAGGPLALLLLAANSPALFDLVRDVTGCDPIGCFDGRVYRLDPAQGHSDSWHSDVGDNRLVAMSVNLGRDRYEGGVLEIREQRSRRVTARVARTAPGDAVIFRIGEHLRHRVSPVTGNAPRVAFAGWFKSAPSFRSVLAGGGWSAPEDR
jgi:hypothetical protein